MKHFLNYQFLMALCFFTGSISILQSNPIKRLESPKEAAIENLDIVQVMKEMRELKRDLLKYQSSPSFFASTRDAALLTTLGALLGLGGGLLHAILSKNSLDELGLLWGPDNDIETGKTIVKALGCVLFATQGAISGLILGLAGKAGSRPKMSTEKLVATLALHNTLVLGVSLLGDHAVSSIAESKILNEMGRAGQVGGLLGRNALFRAYGIAHPARKEEFLIGAELGVGFAQALGLLTLIPEIMIMTSQRNGLDRERQVLLDSLRELEVIVASAKK